MNSNFVEALKSTRRLGLCRELNADATLHAAKREVDPLSSCAPLENDLAAPRLCGHLRWTPLFRKSLVILLAVRHSNGVQR